MLKDVFQTYSNRLIDLSARNRSIFLPKLIGSQMVDLENFNFLNNHPSFFYITELLGRKKNIPLIRLTDARDKNVNEMSRRLRRVQRQVEVVEQETGEKNVFVGWPFVEGKLINDQFIRCPLILFPVTLDRDETSWYLKKKAGNPPFLNRAFLLAYAHAHGLKLDKEWLETSLEDFSHDPTAFRTELYHHLNKGLTLNFSQELLRDRLDFLPDTDRSSFERTHQTGLLKLMPYAVVGQFPQKASFLLDDYESLQQNPHPDLESFLAEKFSVEEDRIPRKREELFNTFPIDASQEEVMKAVRTGKSCVVQGPPGTGKSQLICNLVTDFVSRGKKVLVVSQKRAALDVVFQRLSKQGFEPFTALVHDFRFDRKELFKKLSHQIGSLDIYRELNRTLDAIQLERSFNQLVNQIEAHSDFLEEYKNALFDQNECGVPIKQLYVTSSLEDEPMDLRQYYKKYPFDDLDSFLRDFEEYMGYYKRYENSSSFWLHRVDFSDFSPLMLKQFKETLREIRTLQESIHIVLEQFNLDSTALSSVFQIYENREMLDELRNFVETEENFNQLKELLAFPSKEFDILWLENKIDAIKKLIAEEGIEWSVEDESVEAHMSQAIRALQSKDSWRQSLLVWLDSNKYQEVWDLLKKNGLKRDKSGLQILITKLENRLNLNHQYTLLKRKPWINLPKKPFTFPAFNHVATKLKNGIDYRIIIADLDILVNFMVQAGADHLQFKLLFDQIIGIIENLDSQIEGWKSQLSLIQIKHLLSSPNQERIAHIQQDISRDFVELVAFDQLKNKLRKIDLELMPRMIDDYPEKDFNALKSHFISGLKFSWIEHIETKYPVLQEVSAQKTKTLLEEFATAVDEKLNISKFITEIRIRERTFSDLEYNRLNNLITYRDLNHQVTKKKRLWPVRRLMEDFSEEIFRLIPCWLASPETVSALFPLEPLFDLVVFDESSQCFVERGLPALLRGKQLVVAGDKQQLQPYEIYQVRLQTEEEGVETESESLLDLMSQYFKSFNLENHYRSQSLPLIEFSNRYFYNNSLTMLPDREALNQNKAPYKLIQVEGVWDKQTNQAEAAQVIQELKRLRSESTNATIGVVTLNYYQMELILDLMTNDSELAYAENVSVKNIENVQGDEFDIVVFSTGYARNLQGKFTANFGLLARSGGENRLNVAITRAKEKIILVTSLSWKDFNPNWLANPGVRLLYDYLRYVEEVCAGVPVSIEAEKSSGFEVSWYLKNQLMGTYGNHEVKNNSLSKAMDLELLENGEYLAGILTDDQRLYSSRTAKEAFVYHPRLLRQKKWEVVHLFSRQYWIDKEDLLETRFADLS